MGWWNARRNGESLITEETGLVWGDTPADLMDHMLNEISAAFIEELGRPPTNGELRAGLEFALMQEDDEKRYSG